MVDSFNEAQLRMSLVKQLSKKIQILN